MSALSSGTTISRQWELLKLLPGRGPGVEAKTLAAALNDAGYQVSKRTVERDLQQLSLLFPLQCNDKGIPYGWHWAPGCAADLPGVTLSEALTLRLVESSIRQLLPATMLQSLEARFSQASSKLKSLNSDQSAARWLDKVASVSADMALLPPVITPDVLETVQQALLCEQQLNVRYHSLHQQSTKTYVLNPLALVQRGQVTYLIATVEPYTDPLRFALHRIQQVTQLASSAKPPAGFDLNSYLAGGAMQFSEGEQVKLEARATKVLADILLETPLSMDMQLTPDGDSSYIVSATVLQGWQLNWWLLSHSNSLTVLAPLSLRNSIMQQLASALASYNG